MSQFLLDTHALLWAFEGSQELSARVLDILNDPDHTIFVSPISAYEIAFKVNIGKLKALPQSFSTLVTESDFAVLPLTSEHFERAGHLPLLNRDPWDRLLSAQALIEDMPLISRDTRMTGLGAKIVW
jgi:PIN domain nuclease of toxin-antitoxin system